jgi:PAS domain S-box-containing protein
LYKLFLPFSFLLLFAAVVGISVYLNQRIKADVNQAIHSDMTQALAVGENDISSKLNDYRKDLFYLQAAAATQTFSNKITAQSDELENATNDVKQTFIALMAQEPAIDQVRLLSIEEGFELIKVDRTETGFQIIEGDQLQNKSQRDYYLSSKRLAFGDYYISPITLNREFGEIELPITPTIRLAMPVWNDAQSANTLLVINVNAAILLNSVKASIDSRFDTYLLNRNDQFLAHPKEGVAFIHEFSSDISMQTQYELRDDTNSQFIDLYPQSNEYQRKLALEKTLSLKVDSEENTLRLFVAMPVDERDVILRSQYSLQIIVMLILVMIIGGLLLFFNLYIKRKIELANTQTEYKAIIDGSLDAIISLDTHAQLLTMNKAAAKLLRIDESRVSGDSLDTVLSGIALNISDIIEDVVKRRLPLQQFVSTMDVDNIKHLQVIATPIAKEEKHIEGIALILRDITKEREAEEQIKSANKDLEKQVEERTQELNVAKNMAEAASRTKSAFISSVSHEMRTPLNGIVGSLELIKKDGLSENQLSYLNLTDISIKNLSNLVNDILDLSKIEAGKLEFRYEDIDLLETIEETMSMFQSIAVEKGISLLLDISQLTEHKVFADAYRVKQIINNLLSNATKFTHDGHIIVTPVTRVLDGNVILTCSVEDTGIGIPEARQAQMFTAFEQATINTSHTYGGTGLGLSICRQLCQLMNGNIQLTSKLDEGSKFTFEVALSKSQEDSDKFETGELLKGLKIALLLANNEEHACLSLNIVSLGGLVVNNLDDKGIDIVLVDEFYPNVALIKEQYESSLQKSTIWIDYGQVSRSPRVDVNGKTAMLSKPLAMINLLPIVATIKPDNLALTSKVASLRTNMHSDFASMDDIRGGRILVVDDNEINLAILRGMLEDTELSVFTAKNGAEAIGFLNKAGKSKLSVDLLLLDCNMPVMDGFECTQRIRDGEAGEENKNIHIIAATADAMVGDRERCLDAGMNDYLAKPINKDVLLGKVAQQMRKHTRNQ